MRWVECLVALMACRRHNAETSARLLDALDQRKAAAAGAAEEGNRVAMIADEGRRQIETVRTEIKARTARQEAIARNKPVHTSDIRDLVDAMLNNPAGKDEGEGSC